MSQFPVELEGFEPEIPEFGNQPVCGHVVNQLQGPDRGDYHLIQVTSIQGAPPPTPVLLIVATRHEGREIHPGCKEFVGVSRVLRPSEFGSNTFAFNQVDYIAIASLTA